MVAHAARGIRLQWLGNSQARQAVTMQPLSIEIPREEIPCGCVPRSTEGQGCPTQSEGLLPPSGALTLRTRHKLGQADDIMIQYSTSTGTVLVPKY